MNNLDLEIINTYIVPYLSYYDRLNLSKVLNLDIVSNKNNLVCGMCRSSSALIFSDEPLPSKDLQKECWCEQYNCYRCYSMHEERDLYATCINCCNYHLICPDCSDIKSKLNLDKDDDPETYDRYSKMNLDDVDDYYKCFYYDRNSRIYLCKSLGFCGHFYEDIIKIRPNKYFGISGTFNFEDLDPKIIDLKYMNI